MEENVGTGLGTVLGFSS